MQPTPTALTTILAHPRLVYGMLAGVYGCYVMVKREIPYGWRGQVASGYITGAGAFIIGLASLLGGLFWAFAPEVAVRFMTTAH